MLSALEEVDAGKKKLFKIGNAPRNLPIHVLQEYCMGFYDDSTYLPRLNFEGNDLLDRTICLSVDERGHPEDCGNFFEDLGVYFIFVGVYDYGHNHWNGSLLGDTDPSFFSVYGNFSEKPMIIKLRNIRMKQREKLIYYKIKKNKNK